MEKVAQQNKALKEIEAEEDHISSICYWNKRYSENTRDSNQSQKIWSIKEVQKVFELVKPFHPNQETMETIKRVEKNFDDLYEKFEQEIDDLSEQGKSQGLRTSDEVEELYLKLCVWRPLTYVDGKFVRNPKYANRLFHTWDAERKKHSQIFKEVFHNLSIKYDWNIPLVNQSKCDNCSICKPTSKT